MKKVAVLVSTYNGEKYLEEQIISLTKQIDVDITIYARDDGSKDNTLRILEKWRMNGILEWYQGDNLGPALSFMDLIKNAPIADYYAFCDQDDIWDNDKLKVALEMLESYSQDEPGLYFSNKRLVNEQLETLEITNQNPKLTLGSALIINPVTGCTQVINRKLLEIIKEYDNKNLHMHDGWIYRVCMAVRGNVIFDKNPHILYRQHANNVIGGRSTFSKKINRRIKSAFIKERIREREAKELIKGYSSIISDENLEIIEKVANYRCSFESKLNLLFDKRIRTNSLEHNISFIIAVLINAL